ncbi:unnamed protein product [Mytilus edulis]|uniref:Uncharacterized protein n=1 Tax=Mytilus edulis TaxID=6550 RepID=A0A8S3QW91_MYTED|nr:unnamed protein product [Mytilus edulis]
MTHQGCKILIDSATRQIKNRINDIAFEERSTVSSSSSKSSLRSSTSSRQSQMSSVILRTRAKAKVATTRLKFVELETEMKKKQASLDEQKARADREKANLAAELDLLEAKREAAAAEAEVDALSESPESSETSVKYELNIQSEPLDAKARTKTYVQQLNSAKQDVQTRVTNNNQHIESSYRVTETNLDPRVEPFIPSQSVAAYPPFGHFVEFLRDQSRIKNNPSFFYETTPFKKENNFQKRSERNTQIHVKKTETTDPHKPLSLPDNNSAKQKCPLHLTEHSLNKCRVFRAKPIGERIKFIKEKRICFKCCESTSHIKRDCKNVVRCKECNSDEHPSALHVDHTHVNSSTQQTQDRVKPSENRTDNGGEYSGTTKALCTRICGGFSGKSCSKIILVNAFLKDKPENVVRLYVMIDDQSNRTLASSQLFDMLAVEGDETEYTLVSCSGKVRTTGRRTNGLVVESIDRAVQLDMPTVIECENLPDNRNEIPTPEVAESFYHLQDIAHHIPQIDNEAHIMMLIGRDVISAHHVLDQRIGLANLPYAQKLRLGWCIIGESCLGSVHVPKELRVNKPVSLKMEDPHCLILVITK